MPSSFARLCIFKKVKCIQEKKSNIMANTASNGKEMAVYV